MNNLSHLSRHYLECFYVEEASEKQRHTPYCKINRDDECQPASGWFEIQEHAGRGWSQYLLSQPMDVIDSSGVEWEKYLAARRECLDSQNFSQWRNTSFIGAAYGAYGSVNQRWHDSETSSRMRACMDYDLSGRYGSYVYVIVKDDKNAVLDWLPPGSGGYSFYCWPYPNW